MNQSVRARTKGENKDIGDKFLADLDLFALSVTFSLRDFLQETFNVHTHVWS